MDQQLRQPGRSSFDVQSAGKHTVRDHSLLDTAFHDRPNLMNPFGYLVLAAPAKLVGQNHFRDGLPMLRAPEQQIFATLEVIRDRSWRNRGMVGAICCYKTAANRIVIGRLQLLSGRAISGKTQAIRMPGEHLVRMKDQMPRLIKRNAVASQQSNGMARTD